MKKLWLILILAALVLAGSAYGIYAWHSAKAKHIAYTLAAVEQGTLDETVSANGLVEPREVFVVGSDLAGKVVAVLADYNQTVQEGDELLRLDDRMAQARLSKAKIAVELAQTAVKQAEVEREGADAAYRRLRDMSKEVRNQTDVEIAHDKLRAAEVAVQEARLKVREAEDARRQAEVGLQLTHVRAPVLQTDSPANRPGTGVVAADGEPAHGKRSFLVLERKVKLNQEIGSSVQGHLFTLASRLQRMRVMAQVGEGDIDKVRRGMAARFSVGGGGDDAPKFSASVEDIHLMPSHEHGAVYFEVVLDARNERDRDSGDWKLRPGLTASVDIIRRSHHAAWKVPTAALQFEPAADQQSKAAHAKLGRRDSLKEPKQWQTVWTVGADGKAEPIFVRTGGTGEHGETGIQDEHFTEALEWDSDANDPAELKVIIAAPPPKKSIFNIPDIKF